MREPRVTGIVVLVAALHVTVLSIVFGPGHVGYTVSAALSASWIWGAVFLLTARKRLVGLLAAVAVALAVQQVAYRVWRAELPVYWVPYVMAFSCAQVVLVTLWHLLHPGKPLSKPRVAELREDCQYRRVSCA